MSAVAKDNPIWALQATMLRMPQTEVPTEHFFANGMYLRHVWRPKGMTIVGRVHKQEHFAICALGRIAISDGYTASVVCAGDVRVSKPGTKRITYALEDSVLITVHKVSSQDLETVEAEISEIDPDAAFGVGNELKRERIEQCP
jgi:hypothetical protein